MTIESLYEKYAAYVRELRQELDSLPDAGSAEPYRPPLLSLDDFRAMWERGGRQNGFHDRWLRRFVAGYARDVAEVRERLAEVLGVSPTKRSGPMAVNEDKAAA